MVADPPGSNHKPVVRPLALCVQTRPQSATSAMSKGHKGRHQRNRKETGTQHKEHKSSNVPSKQRLIRG